MPGWRLAVRMNGVRRTIDCLLGGVWRLAFGIGQLAVGGNQHAPMAEPADDAMTSGKSAFGQGLAFGIVQWHR